MRATKANFITASLAVLIIFLSMAGCFSRKHYTDPTLPEIFEYYPDSGGVALEIHFQRGKQHNHPLMVFWLEDEDGNYLKTIYVAASIGKGVFRYGAEGDGHWMPGEIQRPSSLPFWAHKRGVQNEFGNFVPSPSVPVPDAITGPTPKRNFVIKTNTGQDIPQKFVLMMEINQSWDFNEYWTSGKFPGNAEYLASCQPALVYQAVIDLNNKETDSYSLEPVGHSHYDGSDGSLTTDLSTITTALEIAREVKVIIP